MVSEIVAGAVFLSCAAVIAADDYAFRIVPDRMLLILFATGAFYGVLGRAKTGEDWQDTIADLALRSAVPALSVLLVALAYKLVRGREGLGLGDVKLVAAAGIWLPIDASFYAIAAASIVALASTVAIGLWRGKGSALVDSLPFALFLAPAFWLLWVLEETGFLAALS